MKIKRILCFVLTTLLLTASSSLALAAQTPGNGETSEDIGADRSGETSDHTGTARDSGISGEIDADDNGEASGEISIAKNGEASDAIGIAKDGGTSEENGIVRGSEASEETTLRVGFFAFSGYHILLENGRRSGYGYEFLQKLATHADWVYEYVGYDSSYSDALEMLKSGEVDIVTSVTKTPEREEDFLFSNQDIGSNSTIFTVKAGNTKVVEGDYSTYDGLTIGMLEGNSKNVNFENFAMEHGFTFTPQYYETEGELTEALQAEQLDGIVTGSLRVMDNEWLIESFSANPFYICVRKDQKELMDQINEAINEMDLQEPDWRNTLHDKYYTTDQSGTIVLNAAERTFLQNLTDSGRKLKVLANPSRRPYSYFQEGEAKGIFPAIFSVLAERLSLPYEFLQVKDKAEYYALRKAGAADIVLDFASDYYLAEEENYKITSPYFQTTFTRLTRKDFDGEIQTLASINQSDILSIYVTEMYPPEMLVFYDSVKDCVEAVKNGEADATILYSYMADQFIREDVRHLLSSTLLGDTSLSYSIGVHEQDGSLQLSLLNKAVSSLSETELSTITAREIDAGRTTPHYSLTSFLYDNPVYVVLGTAFLLLLLFAIAMLVVRTRNQKTLEKKIARATEELEAKTQELSAALSAADAANKAKTTFLNSMSHDIRTPMNAIIGFTALATTHLDNRERVQDYLAKIANASNHLLSLINDVLDMSRIESGKVVIEERPEDLADILQGLRNIIQSDIHAKRLELFIETVDVADEDIFCDRLRLNQILLNLLSNAIKFTEPGGSVTLRVTQRPSSREGCGLYEFRIIDTGIGMSPEFAATVFEPFTRERTTTVSGIQGTGLGMAITKNIVDMMQGTISVNSKQGEGTEFIVNLEFRFSAAHQEMEVITELHNLRSLVVDDDLVSCQSVSKMLRQIGMRAEWTLSGVAAIARTEEAIDLRDPFEVYIVDWSMPDMSGVETVRQIRRIVGQDSPIILMSAYDWADIEEEARQAGVTDFISKPLFASDLHRTLEKSLGHAPAESSRPISIPKADFHGKHILLAEDNALNQEIAVELLEEAGFNVDCAENGQEAYDRIRTSEPGFYELILMDIQMPIMDGYEATTKIRQLEDPILAGIPIIAMTANAFEEDRDKALQTGMNGHLAKPIDIEQMMKVLHNVFAKNL